METTTPSLAMVRANEATAELEPDSAATLRAAFEEMFGQADVWAKTAKTICVTDIHDERSMKLARETRLALRDIRVKSDHARKRLKEDSVRRGKAIDGIANVLKDIVVPLEAYLLEQETFAERHEMARRNELRGVRETALRELGADPSVWVGLGDADEPTWASIYEMATNAKAAKEETARREAAAKREAERLEAEKREAARAERLRLEAERKIELAALAAERDRLETEKAAMAAAARVEAERIEAERERLTSEKREMAAAIDHERATQAKRLEAVQSALHEAERMQAERLEAERNAAWSHEQARLEAAKAPDREKLHAFALSVQSSCPSFTSPSLQIAVNELVERFTDRLAKIGGAL